MPRLCSESSRPYPGRSALHAVCMAMGVLPANPGTGSLAEKTCAYVLLEAVAVLPDKDSQPL